MSTGRNGSGGSRPRFVLDCSVALAWCFPDEQAPYPQSVLDALATAKAVVPSLWPLELANAFVMGERRQRSTPADTETWKSFLATLPIIIDAETSERAWNETLDLARRHNLTVYDAAYLELAIREGVPLATLDARLLKAATAEGVAAYDPG